jgi:hypothetical protein
MRNAIRFAAIIFSVITLSVLLAHLFELPGKMKLSLQEYQIVQSVYSGWAWLGVVEIGAILLVSIWLYRERNTTKRFRFLLSAVLLFVASLIIFFVFTFPTNVQTRNWTLLPTHWQALRNKWEYSHAVRAVLNLGGFSFLMATLLVRRRTGAGYSKQPNGSASSYSRTSKTG